MTNSLAYSNHHASDASDIFGFWLYIMSDCILFAMIFATYAVLHTSLYGGPSIKELTNIPYIFAETLALLTSSFTFGMAAIAFYQHNKCKVLFWTILTFLLGFSFVCMEMYEFVNLLQEGHSWQNSAAMSAFFTLVGTHGLHVSAGLLWMLVLGIQLTCFGITPMMQRRFTYLGLFWAFLDIVWIFVFTIVYLMEAV